MTTVYAWVCVCTARRHLNCVQRGKRILSNLTLFNANTVRMHLALYCYCCCYYCFCCCRMCTVNSRLLLKIAHFLSMRLWIFLYFCFVLPFRVEHDSIFSLPPSDLINIYTTLMNHVVASCQHLCDIPHRLSTLSSIKSILSMRNVFTIYCLVHADTFHSPCSIHVLSYVAVVKFILFWKSAVKFCVYVCCAVSCFSSSDVISNVTIRFRKHLMP